jgi:hypothetical protein
VLRRSGFLAQNPASVGQALKGHRLDAALLLLLFILTLLPFLPGLIAGSCLYFRDLSVYFFPLRRFFLDGLARGELRYWNPFVHEGKPEVFPVSYPLDLLQLLWPDERGLTLLLVLHVPLCAVSFFLLGRGLGLRAPAAFLGGVAYALGGFTLSTVNLYPYVQAMAWAPLAVLGGVVILPGGTGRVAFLALVTATLLSTTGAEIVGQALLLCWVLAFVTHGRACLARLSAGLGLALGLVAPTVLVLLGLIRDSARGQGYPPSVVLGHSIPPVTWLQTMVGNLHGDLANLVGRFWGEAHASGGFPYFLSYYLGAATVTVAACGIAYGGRRGRILAILIAGFALVALGAHGILRPLVETFPALRAFRYPAKAFFTVHTAAALLAALGLHSLLQGDVRRWRLVAGLGLGFAALSALAIGLLASPPTLDALTHGLFPPGYGIDRRLALARIVVQDAALGGILAAMGGVLGALVARGRLLPSLAAWGLVAVVAADLLRTGTGLNPMVTASFYRLSPEIEALAEGFRRGGARVYTCPAPTSRAYLEVAQGYHEDRDAWSFGLQADTLSPYNNVALGVHTALSGDLTGFVPTERLLAPQDERCDAVPRLVPAMRAAGVSHVISLDPQESPDLELEAVLHPRRIAPLGLHVYSLRDRLPLRAVARTVRRASSQPDAEQAAREPGFLASGGVVVEGPVPGSGGEGELTVVSERPGRLELRLAASNATVVVVRDAWAPGWKATVDGANAPVLRADGRHLAVPVPAGPSRVVLSYAPPGLRPGLAIGAAAASVVAALLWRASASASQPRRNSSVGTLER